MSEYSATELINDGIDYMGSGDVVKRVLIGGLLISFSILILPVIYIFGYYVDVFQQTINGEDTPPVFSTDDIGDRFKHGLGGIAVSVIHSIPVLTLFVVVVGGVVGLGYSTGIGEGSLILAAILGGGIGLIGSVYLGLVFPAALLLYVDTGSITDTLSVTDLKSIITCKQYIIAFILSFALLNVAGLIAGLIGLIPFIGFLFIGFIHFPAIVVSYRMFGQAATHSEYNFTKNTPQPKE